MGRVAVSLALIASAFSPPAPAAVAVVVNHTDSAVAFTVSDPSGVSQRVTLKPRQPRPLFSTKPLVATYPTESGPVSAALAADAVYRFARTRLAGRSALSLRRIGVAREGGVA
ncbi:MAG: hypothetical protein AAF743_05695, partial [Planctomycetota bacterium]